MNIALCIPTCGHPTWGLFDSMVQFLAYHHALHPGISITVIRPPRPLPIDIARTYLAEQVLKSDYDYLWFVDQDCMFVPPTLDRLLSRDVDIVGALCMMRMTNACPPMVYRGQNEAKDQWMVATQAVHDVLRVNYNCLTNAPQILETPPDDSLFESDFTGCHCLLIKRGVLEAMEHPYFSGIPGQEDRYFCFKAQRMGYKVYVDFSVLTGHISVERPIGALDFMAHARLLSEVEEDGYD
jgi:hypothetical protein